MHTATRHRILALCATALALGLPAAASATNFLKVYQQALLNDPAYLQAHATYMAAREARPEAFAVLLPQLNVGAAPLSNAHYVDQSGILLLDPVQSATHLEFHHYFL